MADTDVASLPRVLHLDFDATTRRVTSTGLRLEGFTVTDVESLEAALASLQSNPPDAVVIDCSNVEAAERLATEARARQHPLVLLTSREHRVPFEGAQLLPCLVRPFTTPALCRVLYPLVGGRRPSNTSITPTRRRSSDEHVEVPAPQLVMVGDYQLITEIARGGMGTVYLARRTRDVGVSRCYALKLLHSHLASQPNFVSMLQDEAALASRINHQNVAAVCDVGNDGEDQHYIVMDYVEGLALSKLMKRKSRDLPLGVIASVFVDALEGLYAAHTVTDSDGHPLDLVHRDVSPENILIGTDGAARLADFGVAKARIRLTHTVGDVRKGKLAYLAPEQLIDDDTVDGRVDIWAAGGSLWTALTGRPLFSKGADSEVKIMRNILEMEIPPPSQAGRKPDPFLDEIVMRALSRNPSDRFATAREMSEAIREAAMRVGQLASRAEVGAYVLSACRTEVETRRAAAQNAAISLENDRASAEDFQATVVSAPATQVTDDPADETRPEGTTPMAETNSPPPRRWAVAVILLLGLGAAGLAWMNRGSGVERPAAKTSDASPAAEVRPRNEADASAPLSQPRTTPPPETKEPVSKGIDPATPDTDAQNPSSDVTAATPASSSVDVPPNTEDVVIEDDPGETPTTNDARKRATKKRKPRQPEPPPPSPPPTSAAPPEPEPEPEPAPTPASTKDKPKPKSDVLSEANPYR